MFKLQYYLLILTFSRVYKNQRNNIKIIGERGKCPLAHPVATALRLALEILQGRGGISLLDNEDEPIFRGHVLPDQPERLVSFYKLFQLRQTHWIRNPSFILAINGKCMQGKYCKDYYTSHVHTLHIQAIYKHT